MKVRVSEHARFDSFPLRYGFVPDEFLETSSEVEDEAGSANQKPREIRAGNKHFLCTLWSMDGADLGRARLVLSPPSSNDPLHKVVTALSVESIPADRAVSEIIQLKRRRGDITTDFIISTLHPLYAQKRLSTPEALVDIFVQLGVAKAEQKAELLQKLLAEAAEESEALARKYEDLERRNQELEAKIIESETRKPGYRKEKIQVSPVATLEKVEVGKRINSRGETVACTLLKFREPGLPVRKMDGVFDPGGHVTRKAKGLEGHRVRTATWKPEIFRPLEWFRDVYEVD